MFYYYDYDACVVWGDRIIYFKKIKMCNNHPISVHNHTVYTEAKEMIKPLLPYFEYDEKTVNTWSEADTVLKEGKQLFLRNNPAEDGTTVFISMYPNTKSLCGFVLEHTE